MGWFTARLEKLIPIALLGLFVAAIAFGERIGHLDANRVVARLEALHALPAAMAAADSTVGALAPTIAGTFTPDRKTVIVGGGPNYGTTYFGPVPATPPSSKNGRTSSISSRTR